eukprot:m.175317 g.175317  ORF g.175317 m.175317 type:complete len:83 (-) comp15422_c0_seq6:548-796(-)
MQYFLKKSFGKAIYRVRSSHHDMYHACCCPSYTVEWRRGYITNAIHKAEEQPTNRLIIKNENAEKHCIDANHDWYNTHIIWS